MLMLVYHCLQAFPALILAYLNFVDVVVLLFLDLLFVLIIVKCLGRSEIF